MNWMRRQLQPPAPVPGHCANCGAALGDPRPKFCGSCGQETEIKAPTLGEFIQQFGGAYFSTEGALWRTLWRLLLLPGQLTIEYWAGRRRHYVLPLRLYLTLSLVLLLALRLSSEQGWNIEGPPNETKAGTTAGTEAVESEPLASSASSAPALVTAPASSPRPGDSRTAQGPLVIDAGDREEIQLLELGFWRAGMHKGQFYCEGLSPRFCKRLEHRLTADEATLKREFADLPTRALDHLGQAMFVLLPAFALWLKLFYIDKRRRYTEHLVFALHQHAFWFVMLALLTLKFEPLAIFCALGIVIHPLVSLHRVYRTRWWSTLLRALALMMAYVTSLALVLAAVFIYLFAS